VNDSEGLDAQPDAGHPGTDQKVRAAEEGEGARKTAATFDIAEGLVK